MVPMLSSHIFGYFTSHLNEAILNLVFHNYFDVKLYN